MYGYVPVHKKFNINAHARGNDFEVKLQTNTGKALLYYSFRKATNEGTLRRFRLITTGTGSGGQGFYQFEMDEAEIWEVHHNKRGKEKYRSIWTYEADDVIEFSLTC